MNDITFDVAFMHFTRRLSELISQGMPLIPTFKKLEETTRHPILKEAADGVRRRLKAGEVLPESLEMYPDVFDELFVAVVRAGATSGALDENLERYVRMLEFRYSILVGTDYLERDPELRLFAYRLGLLIHCRVRINEALTLASLECGAELQKRVNEVADLDQKDWSIAKAMEKCGIHDGILLNLVRLGELDRYIGEYLILYAGG